MNSEKRAMEFEALICEVQAVATEVQAMRWENEARLRDGLVIIHREDGFAVKAAEMRSYADKFRTLMDK